MAQNLHDFMKQMSAIVEGRTADLSKAGQKAIKNIKKNEADKKKEAEKKDKPANVKESSAEFFRKYSDIIAEAETVAAPKPVTEGKKSMISEGIEDRLEAARAKAAKKGKIKEPEKAKADPKRQVKGTRYGGSKQKDDEQIEEGYGRDYDPGNEFHGDEARRYRDYDYRPNAADMADDRRKEIRYKDGEEVAEDSSGREVDLESIEIDGIDHRDYPDYSDAFVSYAEWNDGTPLTDDELDQFTDENGEMIGELIFGRASDQMTAAGDFARDNIGEDELEETPTEYLLHGIGGHRGDSKEMGGPYKLKKGGMTISSHGSEDEAFKAWTASGRPSGVKIVREGKIDDLKDKQQAEKEADWWGEKTKKSEKKAPAKREVKGKAYGGAKQKDDADE